MPLTLRVGCSRKLGQPGYSSLGASCALDVELDASLIARDPESLRRQIQAAFTTCRAAVAEELARQDDSSLPYPYPGDLAHPHPAPEPPSGSHGSPPSPPRSAPGSNVAPRGGRPASEKQIKAIRAIARRHGADLDGILRHQFRVDRPEELSVAEASTLIDELKADAAV